MIVILAGYGTSQAGKRLGIRVGVLYLQRRPGLFKANFSVFVCCFRRFTNSFLDERKMREHSFFLDGGFCGFRNGVMKYANS